MGAERVWKLTGPKWVKPANQWCVTIFKDVASANTKKQHSGQSIHWFSTKQEAQQFIDEQHEQ